MSAHRVSLLWELCRPTDAVTLLPLSEYPPCSQFSDNIFLGVRTSTSSTGGHYGVYSSGVPWGLSSSGDAWLYDLQQDSDNRSNVALVNTGEDGDGSDSFQIDLFDGSNGHKVNTIDGITLGAHQWTQIGSILAQSGLHTSQGYAHVIQTSGSNPFITYAVINDGGQPGKGTGDGALVASSKGNDEISLEIDSEFSASCNIIPWSLKITHAPPNAPIRLVGAPPGLGYSGVPAGLVIPQGATTDAQGNFSTTGTAPWSSIFSVAAYVGNLRSNMVSLALGDPICND